MRSLFLFVFLLLTNTSRSQLPNVDSLLNVIKKPPEDTGKVIAYRMLTGLTLNSNPLKAVEYGKAGVLLGKKIGFDKGVAGCLLNISTAFSSAGKLDSAMTYINEAITWSKKVGEPARIALAYLNRADYNMQLRILKQSLKDCDTSMLYAEKANKEDTKARIFQTIGSIYFVQDDFTQSKIYYDKAYALYEKGNNKRMMAITLSNIGNVYKHLKAYENGIASFKNAIALGSEIGDQNNLCMYYCNLSDLYYEKGDMVKAEANGLKSLELARRQENEMQVVIAQGSLANAYLKLGKTSDAIRSASEGYRLAKENKDVNTSKIAADQLAEAYFKANNYKEAYTYLQVSKSLDDSLSKEMFHKDVAELQTNFNVNEKDKEILLLNKDKELQGQQLKQQRLMMIAAVAIAVLSFIGIWLFINRNRLRQRMKELELRNQIAADLHDEVGSSLSSIHMLSQMATRQGNEATHKDILARMSSNAKETMDKMGDIVWMIKPGETEARSLKQRMERFAYEICSSKNIEVAMQVNDLEKIRLTMEQRKNIYLIFKEAVNNAVKYSGTEKIDVTAVIANKQLVIEIIDFGNGFDENIVKKGNGLDNMQHRAKDLGALLTIHSKVNESTSVRIAMPA
jgi:two-component system sensor histidine kinase UhpB